MFHQDHSARLLAFVSDIFIPPLKWKVSAAPRFGVSPPAISASGQTQCTPPCPPELLEKKFRSCRSSSPPRCSDTALTLKQPARHHLRTPPRKHIFTAFIPSLPQTHHFLNLKRVRICVLTSSSLLASQNFVQHFVCVQLVWLSGRFLLSSMSARPASLLLSSGFTYPWV